MTPGYNRFGFANSPSSDFLSRPSSSSSSSKFSTRRGDSLFSGSSFSSSNSDKYDKNRKGHDRGVDHESLYRPITLKGSSSGGLYSNSNKDKYSGSRYGTASNNGGSSYSSSSSTNNHNNENDYRPRPHPYEGLSNGGSDNRKDLTLSQMLDMSAINGDNLDLQHKMQIQDLLYSNSSKMTEDARQLGGLILNTSRKKSEKCRDKMVACL